VKKATDGKGADVAINNVGGSVFPECVRALNYEGRLATVGYVDGQLHSEIDLEALHELRLHLYAVSNKRASPAQRVEQVRGFSRTVLPLFNGAQIKPMVDRVFALDELPQAKAYMESNAQVGKIVVRMQ
jgi:NADPH:quinone reductase